MIEGWAWEAENPHGAVLLEILDAGTPIGTVLADQFRPDLHAMNAGRCAFYFPRSGGSSDITVRRVEDGAVLEKTR